MCVFQCVLVSVRACGSMRATVFMDIHTYILYIYKYINVYIYIHICSCLFLFNSSFVTLQLN